MNYAIVYGSRTGNTALLAQRLKEILPSEGLRYFGPPAAEAAEAEVLFVGSWTDRGSCCAEIAAFLESLHGKKVFLFGTAGFGGSSAYFRQIASKVAEHLPSGNELLGSYLCQGKMPEAVRSRYEAMEKTDPEKARPMLENFDRALSHPDEADLQGLSEAVVALFSAN